MPTDAELNAYQQRIEHVRVIVGRHLRFNPWDDHWRLPTTRAAQEIVRELDGSSVPAPVHREEEEADG